MKMDIYVFYPSKTDKASKSIDHVLKDLNDKYKFHRVQPRLKYKCKRAELMKIIKRSNERIMMSWMGGQVVEKYENEKTVLIETGSSIQLVKKLTADDWELIEGQRPIIVGSSDITFLLCELLNHDINCLYGPNFKSTLVDTCDAQREVTIKYLEMALVKKGGYRINWSEPELNPEGIKPWVLSSGEETGRLVGGNIATLYKLYKTDKYKKYRLIRKKGDILLLEDNDVNYMIINGNIVNSQKSVFEELVELGIFDDISGLIIGRTKKPGHVGDANDNKLCGIASYEQECIYIKQILEDCGILKLNNGKSIPILGNVSCSHTHPMVTLPLGRKVTLNAEKQTLTILPAGT